MKNQIEFRKTVETAVDLCLSNCPQCWISNNYNSQCQRLNVGTWLWKLNVFIMNFLNILNVKSKSWKTTVLRLEEQ